MNEEERLEKEIQMRGLTAPRVTPSDVVLAIKGEEFIVFPGSCTTVCELTLANGFRVTGTSACASPANFDTDIGRDIARRNARDKVWELLGFELKSKLAIIQKSAPLPLNDPFRMLGETKTYLGTKVISAVPMNRLDYNVFRGWELPKDENGEDEGYIVMYADGGKPNVPGFSGYISWSPQDVFEKSYQLV